MNPYRYRTEMPKAVDRLTLSEAVLDAREAILTDPTHPLVTVFRDGLPIVTVAREIRVHASQVLTEREQDCLLLLNRSTIDTRYDPRRLDP